MGVQDLNCMMKRGKRMEFELGDGTLMLPSLHILIMAGVIIYFLIRWSREMDRDGYKVYFYFLISAFIMPIYSSYSEGEEFQLYVPVGFVVMFFYLFRSEKYHWAKMKACMLGLIIALYQMIRYYIG